MRLSLPLLVEALLLVYGADSGFSLDLHIFLSEVSLFPKAYQLRSHLMY